MLVLLHLGFDDVSEIDTDPNGRFVSFKITHVNDRVLCVYAPSGHNTIEKLTRGRFFEGLQTYMENKLQENENKIIVGDFNCTKWTGMKEAKHKNFILPCLNSSCIMGWRIYREGRTQIPLSSPVTTDSLAEDPGLTGFILT